MANQMRWRIGFWLIIAGCAVMLGCGSAPVTVEVQVAVTPTSLPFTGGTVNVVATITTNAEGPVTVAGSFTGPGPGGSFALTADGSGRWTGEVSLPANSTSEPQIYTVTVTAVAGGVISEGSAQVTVTGPEGPPSPAF